MCPEPDTDTNAQALSDVHTDVCPICHADASHPNGYCHVTFIDGYTVAHRDADRRAESNFYRDTADTTSDFYPDESADFVTVVNTKRLNITIDHSHADRDAHILVYPDDRGVTVASCTGCGKQLVCEAW